MIDSVLNKITVFLWHLFCLNLMLFASNLLLLGLLLFVILHFITLPLYLIALFLLMISLQAMFLTLKRVEQTEELTVFKQYRLAYVETIKNSGSLMVTYLALFMILIFGYFSTQFVAFNQGLFTSVYLLLAVLLYVHFIFGLLIQTHFVIDGKGTWKLGFYCLVKYPIHCLLIFIKTLAVGWLVQVIPALLLLGIVPLFGYSILKMTKKVFDKLKEILLVEEVETGVNFLE